MEVIGRRWYVIENRFSTSLMRFPYAEISIDEYFANLKVVDSNMDNLNLKFATLENAFNFVENEVNYSHSLGDINDRFQCYNKQIRKSRQKIKSKGYKNN